MEERPLQIKKTPTAAAIAEAKLNPGSWIYEFDEQLDPNQDVSGEAILGAWKVDDFGNIVGDFISNPNYFQQRI